jgi:hypothetical protein
MNLPRRRENDCHDVDRVNDPSPEALLRMGTRSESCGFPVARGRYRRGAAEDHIWLEFDQLFRERSHPTDVATRPTSIDPYIAAIRQLRKPLDECVDPGAELRMLSDHPISTPIRPRALAAARAQRVATQPRHRGPR